MTFTNTHTHKIFIGILVLIDFLCVLLIAAFVYNIFVTQKSKVKGVQVTVLQKENYNFPSTTLTYFFEPKADSILRESPDWLGYEYVNTINKDSLNERYNYSVMKPSKTFRIITLGDSFTFGAYVNTEENYTEILEELLNSNKLCEGIDKIEILNFGVGGYDIEYAVERYRLRGVKYKPDLIIWLINNHNLYYILELLQPFQKRAQDKGIPIYNPKTQHYEAVDVAATELFKQYNEREIKNYTLDRIKRFFNLYKGPIVIAYFPMSKLYIRDYFDVEEEITGKIPYLLELTDITAIENLHLSDRHPNPAGHKKIANELYSYLIKSEILCSGQMISP